jgi:hypothetical protein
LRGLHGPRGGARSTRPWLIIAVSLSKRHVRQVEGNLLCNCNVEPGAECYSLAMHSPGGSRSGIGSTARRTAVACAVTSFTVGALLWACGGTTGHDGDMALASNGTGGDATVTGEAGADASEVYDTGAFDVNILFAPPPDVAARPEGGSTGDGGGEYPNCPPWLPVDQTGNLVDGGDPSAVVVSFVASYYSDGDAGVSPAVAFEADGGVTYAADGGTEPLASAGVCATYPWFPQFNSSCVNGIFSYSTYPPYPPCNWAIGLGNAGAGPGSMTSRYDLCMALYTCIQTTGCWDSGKIASPNECFCGPQNDAGVTGCGLAPPAPNGPCVTEMQAAFEQADLGPAAVALMLSDFDDDFKLPTGAPNTLSAPTYGPYLNEIYENAYAPTSFCRTDAGL